MSETRRQAMRHVRYGGLVLAVLAIGIAGAATSATVDETLPPNYVPSGKLMYQEHCATCHGTDAKGTGPLASLLKTPPADLTLLARRHAGKFPREYVTSVLEFGPGPTAHGSSDMPAWGPIFRYYDKQNERAVQQRIRNLCDYLASLQER
jgi:mono/diheme cytochrome c family protein